MMGKICSGFFGRQYLDDNLFATSFLLYLPGMIIISLFVNEVNF